MFPKPSIPSRLWFGLQRSAILETVGFLVAMLAFDQFLLDGDRFWGANPHPFWIIVAVVAVQYGTAEGIMGAVLSSLALLLWNVPAQSIAHDLYGHLWQIVVNPFFWTLAALVLGELRMRGFRSEQKLQRDLDSVEQRAGELFTSLEETNQAKSRLETVVASQLGSAVSLYEAAKGLEASDPNDVLLGVSKLAAPIMNPEQLSLFLMDDKTLKLALESGWKSDDAYSRTFVSESPLFQKVVGERRVVSATNAEDEAFLQDQGLLAGPLIDTATEEIVGMLKVEKLGFFDLNFSTIQSFQILCDWVATAYARAKRGQQVQSETIVNPQARQFSASFYSRQKDFLTLLARRVPFDLARIMIRVESRQDLSAETWAAISEAVRRSVHEVLRITDLIFEFPGDQRQEFAILMPSTPVRDAQNIVQRLTERMEPALKKEWRWVQLSMTAQSLEEPARQKDGSVTTSSLLGLGERVGPAGGHSLELPVRGPETTRAHPEFSD